MWPNPAQFSAALFSFIGAHAHLGHRLQMLIIFLGTNVSVMMLLWMTTGRTSLEDIEKGLS
jgi:hypothetical protein